MIRVLLGRGERWIISRFVSCELWRRGFEAATKWNREYTLHYFTIAPEYLCSVIFLLPLYVYFVCLPFLFALYVCSMFAQDINFILQIVCLHCYRRHNMLVLLYTERVVFIYTQEGLSTQNFDRYFTKVVSFLPFCDSQSMFSSLYAWLRLTIMSCRAFNCLSLCSNDAKAPFTVFNPWSEEQGFDIRWCSITSWQVNGDQSWGALIWWNSMTKCPPRTHFSIHMLKLAMTPLVFLYPLKNLIY